MRPSRSRLSQAALGAELLRTRFIRKTANDLSYQNPALATEDAINVGAIHTREPAWIDNTVVRAALCLSEREHDPAVSGACPFGSERGS